MMTATLIALALAGAPVGAGRPPINPPGIDCPKGFIFKRGKCWRRTYEEATQVDEDEFEFDAWSVLEKEVERLGRAAGRPKE